MAGAGSTADAAAEEGADDGAEHEALVLLEDEAEEGEDEGAAVEGGADESANNDSDSTGILILFDPSGADDEAVPFKKTRASLGLLLEQLARSDDLGIGVKIWTLGEAKDKVVTTTTGGLSSAGDEQCEEYTEELAAGGGRIMSIPHRIPWVISPVAMTEVDPADALDGVAESLASAAGGIQCYIIAGDSAAAAVAAKRLLDVKAECPDGDFRIWLHSEDVAQHCELPVSADELSLTDCQNDFYALAANDDGPAAFVINGRSPKLVQ